MKNEKYKKNKDIIFNENNEIILLKIFKSCKTS